MTALVSQIRPDIHSASIRGTNIAYIDTGGPGPAVVFTHGFAMDHAMFDPQVADLGSDFRVIAWDQRGWGGTRATGPFTLWDSARDLLGLLEHLDVMRAVLCGMSQGGFVAMRAALLAPAQMRGLVLLGTQAGLEDRSGPDEIISTWMQYGPGPVQDRLASALLGPGDWSAWFAKWENMDRQQLDWAYRCLMERDDLTGRLPEIHCPVLVLHGTHDDAVPLERAQVLRSRIGGRTSFVAIEGGRHASNITHAVVVNAAMRSFLASIQGSS
jgi:3-oxoadipate enol-lactonase